jgi:hypothetical protein
MSKPWEINCESCLVIPDIHHCIGWARSVISHEKNNFDRLLFNGDIIDYRNAVEASNVTDTAMFYKELLELYDVNIGNHDVSTMEWWHVVQAHRNLHNAMYSCGGQSHNRNREFNKLVTWEEWQKATLFRKVNGWLVSHAGMCAHWCWDHKKSIDENLEYLWNDSKEAMSTFGRRHNRWFSCGRARGGDAMIGGPVWCDFDYEFQDTLPLPQIVGHTAVYNTVRRIGRSYGIDGKQSTYCLINRQGDVVFKSLKYVPEIGNIHYEPQQPTICNNDDLVDDN